MKNTILTSVVLMVSAICISCSKEGLCEQQAPDENNPVAITLHAVLGEFDSDTKSTAESCIRMKWDASKDVVWAYGSDGDSLGCLTVSTPKSDYLAVLEGDLKSAPADGNLFLVHSSFNKAPTRNGNVLTIDMSSQDKDVIPFVASALVENVKGTDKSSYAASGIQTFNFATSVLKVSATGIAKGAKVTSATIDKIETACQLKIGGSGFTVAGTNGTGTLTKALDVTSSLSSVNFYVGVPCFAAAAPGANGRTLTVKAGDKDYHEHNVMQSGKDKNKYVSYLYDVRTLNYVDDYGVDRGVGTYIPSTCVVWAPVNCGYDDEHIYGLLYQWGRKYGQAYEGGNMTPEELTKVQGEDPSNCGKFGLYNDDDGNWFSGGVDNNLWSDGGRGTYDPCPTGWRVPTKTELTALIANKSSWTDYTVGGVSLNGYWYSGSTDYGSSVAQVFLPAAGCLNYSDGKVLDRGTSGNYWSSSIDDNDDDDYSAYVMSMDSRFGAFTGSSLPRAYGCSVRCVQE